MKTQNSLIQKTQRHTIFVFIVFALIVVSLLTSCASTYDTFSYDDVYSVKNNDYPPYESVADETSYGAFKNRKWSNANEIQEQPQYTEETDGRTQKYSHVQENKNCEDQMRWYDGCGCSYSEWQRNSRYSSYNRTNLTIVVGSSFWGIGYNYPYSYYSQYWSWRPSIYWGYGYHGLYSGYIMPMYNHMIVINNYWAGYYNPYVYSPYGYYGYGHGYYGHGYGYGYGYGHGYLKNSGTQYSQKNVYSGHREINSTGNANPNGRKYQPNTLKTTVTTSNGKVEAANNIDRNVHSRTVSKANSLENKQLATRELSAKETVVNVRPIERSSNTNAVKTVDTKQIGRVVNNTERETLKGTETGQRNISNGRVDSPVNARSVDRSSVTVSQPTTSPQRSIINNRSSETEYRKVYPQRSISSGTNSNSQGISREKPSQGSYNNRSTVPSSTRVKSREVSPTPSRSTSPAPRQQSSATPQRSTTPARSTATPSSSTRSNSGSSGSSTRSSAGRSR